MQAKEFSEEKAEGTVDPVSIMNFADTKIGAEITSLEMAQKVPEGKDGCESPLATLKTRVKQEEPGKDAAKPEVTIDGNSSGKK